jgi:hypothetical protein
MLENNTPPVLMTVQDVAAALRVTKPTARRFIWKQLSPLGGVVKIGSRLLVQAWAFNKWLRHHSVQETPEVIAQRAQRYAIQREQMARRHAKETV